MQAAEKRGVLFVFSGPSGVGKGTLNHMLFEEFGGQIAFSISATTRAPRPGETDGKEYFFISRQEFDQRVQNNDFLEHAQYSGNCYGTPRSYVEGLLSRGVHVLLEIEVNGAQQVMRAMPDCVSIFILPPSFEVLEQRLRGRGTESEEVIRRRLDTARRELSCASQYDYQVVNGEDIDASYRQLRDIYLAHTQQQGLR